MNQETVWIPGLLTSTLCCRWVGSELRLLEYSFRCTAGVQRRGCRAEGETQATAGVGVTEERERPEGWGSGSSGEGRGEGTREGAYCKWLCRWAGTWCHCRDDSLEPKLNQRDGSQGWERNTRAKQGRIRLSRLVPDPARDLDQALVQGLHDQTCSPGSRGLSGAISSLLSTEEPLSWLSLEGPRAGARPPDSWLRRFIPI